MYVSNVLIVDLIVIIATVEMGPTTNGKEVIGHHQYYLF